MRVSQLFDFLFPPICIGCGADSAQVFCGACKESLTASVSLHCPVCRRYLPLNMLTAARNNRCHPSTSHLIISAAPYENSVVRSLIWQLKFKRRADAAVILGQLLVSALAQADLNFSEYLFVPIPLSAARLRTRGFNQAQLLTDYICEKKSVTQMPALIRVKDTVAQSDADTWMQRRINIAGVYQLASGINVKNKKIVLVDDVWTSGATLSEATSVLKQAGASEVIGLVVARAGS